MAQRVKNLPANARDVGLIPGWGISPGGGNGNPLEYSCLENPMDRGAWWIQRVRHDLVTECTHSGEETPQYALKDVQNVNKKRAEGRQFQDKVTKQR